MEFVYMYGSELELWRALALTILVSRVAENGRRTGTYERGNRPLNRDAYPHRRSRRCRIHYIQRQYGTDLVLWSSNPCYFI